MKISDFRNLIKELPFYNQSFSIKESIWKNDSQSELISKVFDNKKSITLNRYDLFNSSYNLPEFIIKTLMWGYPTKGRGNNIDIMLLDENFKKLTNILIGCTETDITFSEIEKMVKEVNGIGISTITKFLYFLNTSIEGNRAVILDKQIIDIIHSGKYEEFKSLKNIRYDNAFKKYAEYLTIVNNLSRELKVKPDQIEFFLFVFGKSLSELKGEECYDEDILN